MFHVSGMFGPPVRELSYHACHLLGACFNCLLVTLIPRLGVFDHTVTGGRHSALLNMNQL